MSTIRIRAGSALGVAQHCGVTAVIAGIRTMDRVAWCRRSAIEMGRSLVLPLS